MDTEFYGTSSVSTGMGDCLWAGIPPWSVTKPTRPTQPCIPLGLLNRVPALIGRGKGGNVTSAGWQVTLCDLIWHVSSRSGAVLVAQTVIRFLSFLTITGLLVAGERDVVGGGRERVQVDGERAAGGVDDATEIREQSGAGECRRTAGDRQQPLARRVSAREPHRAPAGTPRRHPARRRLRLRTQRRHTGAVGFVLPVESLPSRCCRQVPSQSPRSPDSTAASSS